MGPVSLLMPPDYFGYMDDPHYQIIIATYLGQPYLVMAPVVGRFFEKQGAKLDKYDTKFTAVALPGQGHLASHSQLQSIV